MTDSGPTGSMRARRGPGWGVGEAGGCLPQAVPLTPGPSCSWAPPKTARCPPRPRLVWWGQKNSCLAESHTSPRRWSCPGRRVSSGSFSPHVPHQCRLRSLGAKEEAPTISPSKERPQGRSHVGPRAHPALQHGHPPHTWGHTAQLGPGQAASPPAGRQMDGQM